VYYGGLHCDNRITGADGGRTVILSVKLKEKIACRQKTAGSVHQSQQPVPDILESGFVRYYRKRRLPQQIDRDGQERGRELHSFRF
jgi:hypothetical protein